MDKYNFSLESIEISKIKPNPINPRGKHVREEDKDFQYLKRSLKEFGLLVPIVVRKISEEKYQLIDGERRFWALKEIGTVKAPAHVLSNRINEETAKNVMFHIHTNRVDWQAYQQCLALEPLYKKLKARYGNNEIKIADEMVKLTSTHKRTINDRLNFLRWPYNLKKIVYEEKNELYWSIVEIEKGFIKPAEQSFPQYFRRVSKNKVRRLLLEKFIEGHVHAATEVRKAKPIVQTSKEFKDQHDYASRIFKNLINNKSYSFEEAMHDFQAKYPYPQSSQKKTMKRLVRHMHGLIEKMSEYDFSQFNLVQKSARREFIEAYQDLEILIENLRGQYPDVFEG